ncbi:P-loop containing nucleoside triphosphate hydrolase protein [Schizophyllum fasciatum]
MSSLEKLAIRGIRSFDDKQISVIEFFNPVTVIVGHNGSGKTTIIECLKYATTGDQPPNTRGGAFVHDPKMANEKEVKAQVKLRFHAANGQLMLAVRNLSVTLKKPAGMTMKTLESILAVADEAQQGKKRGAISTRCAEMDVEIPQLLGVSKAVLENVIFCHQEDSYWPLSEASTLKKKFDDIFEATKYTKALESIKQVRKDRVADLKTEKVRLEGIARDKAQYDKLKSRISDLSQTIVAKEAEYDQVKVEYEAMVDANQKLYEQANAFRETYMRVQTLEDQKKRLKQDIEDAKAEMKEEEGSDEELRERLRNHERHIEKEKGRRLTELNAKEDLEEELKAVREEQMHDTARLGKLRAEKEAQEQRIRDREQLIRDLAAKHGLSGFNVSPLSADKVVEFISRLEDALRRSKDELDGQTQDEHQKQLLDLEKKVDALRTKKSNMKSNLAEKQASVVRDEATLDDMQDIPAQLANVDSEIEDKAEKLKKLREQIKAANYDKQIEDKAREARQLDDQRNEASREFRFLSSQAEIRAKLQLKRTEVQTKTKEIQTTIEGSRVKFRKLLQKDPAAESMEKDLDKARIERESEQENLDKQATNATSAVQNSETAITAMRQEVKQNKERIRVLERNIKRVLNDRPTIEQAISEAKEEIEIRRKQIEGLKGGETLLKRWLQLGEENRKCPACVRRMDDRDFKDFEKIMKEHIMNADPKKLDGTKTEMEEWQQELDELEGLIPLQMELERLKEETPALETKIKAQEDALPGLSAQADEITDKIDLLRKQSHEVQTLKLQAANVGRLQKDIERLGQEITEIEHDLSVTGSTKSTDDLQAEIEKMTDQIRSLEREKNHITADSNRMNNSVISTERELHALQTRRMELTSKLEKMKTLETNIAEAKKRIEEIAVDQKDIDARIQEAQSPIDALNAQWDTVRAELRAAIETASEHTRTLNVDSDKLSGINKAVERYVKEKGQRVLGDCIKAVEQRKQDIEDLAERVEQQRRVIEKIDKEINESGASQASLRENIRVRKLQKEIADIQSEIDKVDMEEIARSRRAFKDQYKPAKEKETELQGQYSHIGGMLTSSREQLATWEKDLRDFKDINKKYADQLIKVKMSDMANNDLEKYAKALDSAIMKYHSLKMEEVNDTMRHLWNKTYQGTDIDGIKIRSDAEGGASKRSYNYRVVMTKDQVEMDMRGRCSAGQKMLASIIIRLALSDSFGQNCGILALDEPTNALDTENIDALASSLVDIINERKNHSNFQLIIITHDENFLRKLGQSEVMEHYWRIQRDSRQKSIILRERFR